MASSSVAPFQSSSQWTLSHWKQPRKKPSTWLVPKEFVVPPPPHLSSPMSPKPLAARVLRPIKLCLSIMLCGRHALPGHTIDDDKGTKMTNRNGQQLGNYRLIRLLGRG